MADLAQVESALQKAHAAGDSEGARVLAGEVRRLRDFAVVKAEGVTRSEPPKFTPSGEKSLSYENPELLAAHPSVRAAMGAVSPFVGMIQLGAHALGKGRKVDEVLHELEQAKQRGMATLGAEGTDWMGAAGAAASPAWLLAGAGKAAASLPGRMAQGAGVGAVAGATAPVTDGGESFWETKAGQTAAGAAVGAVIPPAGAALAKGGKMVYHGLIEPTFEAGRRAIKGRAYSEAAGDKSAQIIDLLAKNKQLTPGSAPTAGEAAVPAGRAEFSALQESAGKVRPSDYLARSDEQNAARQAAVAEFAGTPAKMAEARAAREAAAAPLYKAGEAQVTWSKSDLTPLLERPSMKSVINRAETLAKERGHEFSLTKKDGSMRPITGEEAQTMKLAFDDVIKLAPKSGMDTAELAALKATRQEYVGWLEKQFPDLAKARAAYKEGSAPVNEMEVGTALQNKLTPALREDAKLRSGVFSGAVRESASTIKKATGEPRFKELKDILTSRSLQKVHGVQDDLARSDRHLDMARRGSAAGPNAVDLATANLEREVGGKVPNLLHRGAMMANAIITRLEGKVNRKLAAEMAVEMLSPPKVGEALAVAKAREARNAAMAEAIVKMQRVVTPPAANAAARQGE